jgi:tetratricopeptide (TPR) repeat protein
MSTLIAARAITEDVSDQKSDVQAGRLADEVILLERHLSRFPNHAPSLHGAAMALVQLGETQRALELLSHLCKLQPWLAEAHYNRGALLGIMQRYEDELDAYRQAIALKPSFVQAYVNLGVALRELHRFDEALIQFKKALSIAPNDASARTTRAWTNLLIGEFEHGWREYEWRWRHNEPHGHGFPEQALWTGAQSIAGKTVFVHHEQGFGDTLQFVRFVDWLSAAGARVVLRVQDALLSLLQGYRGAAEVIGESAQVPLFDYHIPMMSLPFALKIRAPDLAVSGAYLDADDRLAAQWDDLFAQPARRPRIGIVWSGRRTSG